MELEEWKCPNCTTENVAEAKFCSCCEDPRPTLSKSSSKNTTPVKKGTSSKMEEDEEEDEDEEGEEEEEEYDGSR